MTYIKELESVYKTQPCYVCIIATSPEAMTYAKELNSIQKAALFVS